MGPKGLTEPRPEMEAQAEGSAVVPKAGRAVGATVTLGAMTGTRPTTHGTQGAPSSQKSAAPGAR
jgi:hypothetical protein